MIHILAEIHIKARGIHDGFQLKEKVETIYQRFIKKMISSCKQKIP